MSLAYPCLLQLGFVRRLELVELHLPRRRRLVAYLLELLLLRGHHVPQLGVVRPGHRYDLT